MDMGDHAMDHLAAAIIERYWGEAPYSLRHVGGGFYAKVYLARIASPPEHIIVKLALKARFHRRERLQLDTLRRYARLPMPQVYCVHDSDEAIPADALCMAYIPGENAGMLETLPENAAMLADQIVDNLLAWHGTTRDKGFGFLEGEHFPTWQAFYRMRAAETLDKARALAKQDLLPRETLWIMERALAAFDDIFDPAEHIRPGLVHGDYNTWNILLTPGLDAVAGVIDPFNSGWMDTEIDLYQLNNANGRAFGLLENYSKKRALSPSFHRKMPYYELFSEIAHYHDSQVAPIGHLVKRQTAALAAVLD